MNILDYIPFGKENAIKRLELRLKIGLSDRKIRKLIAEARLENVIINLQNGGGYYRPTSEEIKEIEQHYKQEYHRAISILCRLKPERRALKDVG